MDNPGRRCRPSAGPDEAGHPDGLGRPVGEPEPPVERVRVAVGHEGDVRECRRAAFQLVVQGLHDAAAESMALVLGQHADVDDLEEASTVADDPAHADRIAAVDDHHPVPGVGQPHRRALGRLVAETGAGAEPAVVLHRRDAGVDLVCAGIGQGGSPYGSVRRGV
jgi:hypothetical protein